MLYNIIMNPWNDNKLGYYTVGNLTVRSKIDACVLATKSNQWPQWHFNDQIWSSQDWTQEPDIDLLTLYQSRAKQIREQYDYVIINYSGGSDSQTIVEAFFNAGCHIDEIVTIWNQHIDNSPILDVRATHPSNIEAEFYFNTRHKLDWIRQTSPNTKITYVDISKSVLEEYTKNYDGAEWINKTAEHLNPVWITRWDPTRNQSNLYTFDRGLKTALVSGIDKPRVCTKDGKFYAYFLDTLANNGRGNWDTTGHENYDHVLFYWSPDFPQLVVKQAHMVMKWFKANPALGEILQWGTTPLGYVDKTRIYEVLIRSIVYPNWSINTFQCLKVTSPIYTEWDSWFWNKFKDQSVYQSWQQGIKYVENAVDKKFLNYDQNGRLNGFVGMISPHFALEKSG